MSTFDFAIVAACKYIDAQTARQCVSVSKTWRSAACVVLVRHDFGKERGNLEVYYAEHERLRAARKEWVQANHEEIVRLLEGAAGPLPRKLWKRAQYKIGRYFGSAGAYDTKDTYDGATLRYNARSAFGLGPAYANWGLRHLQRYQELFGTTPELDLEYARVYMHTRQRTLCEHHFLRTTAAAAFDSAETKAEVASFLRQP
jgi:hypothetical protein